MIFDIVYFSFIINPFVSMRTVAIHMSEAIRNTPITKEETHLVKRFRTKTPKVPSHVWILNMVIWMFLLTVNKIREFNRVSNEENRGIISYHVIVSFFCIKFHCKP